ncbi:importin-4-like [Thrips palmi]|uniref:Importin-4-like n=1 Tax=Thrips palmi TaxID=161013 RepID=A0A6P9ACL2_THRPL|nr:importin-4-like [Thrips palmi]
MTNSPWAQPVFMQGAGSTDIKMEAILAKLLVADNEVIQKGTAELREAFQKPGVILELCNVVVSSTDPQIRQYAAVLLRKRLSKSKHWAKLSPEEKNAVKQGILPALVNESEKSVRNSIAQFIGSIMKHELHNNSWPELLLFVQQLNTSQNLQERELGMSTLDVFTEVAPKQFLAQSAALCQLIGATLKSAGEQDLASPIVYHAFRTLTNMTVVADQDQPLINMFNEAIPLSLQVVAALAQVDESKAVKVMEFIDGLLDCVIQVVLPHVKTIVTTCLQIAKVTTIGDEIRIKALSFIGEIVSRKKKVIIKNNLMKPIIDVLFELMSTPPEDDEQEEYFVDDDDEETPTTVANQTLDMLALHLPPEKFLPHILEHVEPALTGTSLYAKKAAYLAMAVLVEGCSEYIRNKYIEQFLKCVCTGITDNAGVVRNAALFALGQFSEHLQPEIAEYHEQLLPVLFQYLQQLCTRINQQGEGSKEPAGIDRMFYALEMFCENLGDRLVPYLPVLMESLFVSLTPTNSVHLRELAISAIGAAANAAKEEMVPYFPRIMENLKMYLVEEQPTETLCLQIQAVDTLGVLARTVGEDTFKALSQESLQLALALLKKVDDPDLRKSVYGLLASISSVIKSEVGVVLPEVVQTMLNSIKSQEGILTEYKDDEENAAFPVYDDLSDEDAEEDIENSESSDDDLDVSCFNVENAFMEEKEEACLALGELARQAGIAFMPYMDQCFDEVLKMIQFPHSDIRRAAIDALANFCISLTSIQNEQGNQALLKALSILVPKCSELIHADQDRDVVMSALDAYSEMLSELKGTVLIGDGHREAIINCIRDVLTYKTECQDEDEAGNVPDEDDEDAEQDELLLQYAGNIVPQLGKAMTHEEFAQYFKTVLPLFLAKMKKNSTVAQRSFGVGTIAECMEPLGPCAGHFIPELLPLVLQMSQDNHEEVRNNAIYGLGELVLHAKEVTYPYFPQILQVLSGAVANEKHPGTLDNICGALCRMIITNVEAIPINDVFPVFIQHLPLRQDFEENKMVFKCLSLLYEMGHQALLSQIIPVLKVTMVVLYKAQHPDKETQERVIVLLSNIKRDFPAEFNQAQSELTPKQLETLSKRLAAASS